ncbi:MAG: imidazoleglycerol-phosphate dehydratase HisB [Clostridia bacterium]|nr:imidazoleglycerol-phosphate dehydratase HisB [Clostridia bacterium]NLF20155.1 imidazoleglycerol-phosphate dehydratase HisB [Clostridiaceae bacterium]
MRRAEIERKTQETQVKLRMDLDGSGVGSIDSGIGFFDHMLQQIVRHGNLDLDLRVTGDLEVDAHHTIEDTGLVFGQALLEALGSKAGISRYGLSYVPMDESLARVVIDFSGRPYLYFQADFPYDYLGAYPCEMTKEFFRAVAQTAGMTLHVELLHGENAHHETEAIFKAFGRALRQAVSIDPEVKGIPSTKGTL